MLKKIYGKKEEKKLQIQKNKWEFWLKQEKSQLTHSHSFKNIATQTTKINLEPNYICNNFFSSLFKFFHFHFMTINAVKLCAFKKQPGSKLKKTRIHFFNDTVIEIHTISLEQHEMLTVAAKTLVYAAKSLV